MVQSGNGKTVTFKKTVLLQKEVLISHLLDNPVILNRDFRFLGPHPSGSNDFLLGINRERRLQVVEADIKFEESLLYRSLAHLQGALSDAAIRQKHDRQQESMNVSLMPEIFYVLPEWPPIFIETLGLINNKIHVTLLQYWYVESEKDRGFLFEPVVVRRTDGAADGQNFFAEQMGSLKERAGLSREEIMKFIE